MPNIKISKVHTCWHGRKFRVSNAARWNRCEYLMPPLIPTTSMPTRVSPGGRPVFFFLRKNGWGDTRYRKDCLKLRQMLVGSQFTRMLCYSFSLASKSWCRSMASFATCHRICNLQKAPLAMKKQNAQNLQVLPQGASRSLKIPATFSNSHRNWGVKPTVKLGILGDQGFVEGFSPGWLKTFFDQGS